MAALFLVAAFLAALPAAAQRAVQSPLSVTVKRTKMDSVRKQVELTISLRNMTQQEVETRIEALFIADGLGDGGLDGVYCRKTSTQTLKPSEARDFKTLSDPLESLYVLTSNGEGYRYRYNNKFKGYIVRVFANGTLVRVDGTSPSFEKIAWDDKELGKMLVECSPTPPTTTIGPGGQFVRSFGPGGAVVAPRVSPVPGGGVAAPAVKLVLDEAFADGPLGGKWRVMKNTSADASVEVKREALRVRSPANGFAGVEHDLPPGTTAVSVEVSKGSDFGGVWGPGLALVWPDGKTAELYLHTPDMKWGTSVDGTAMTRERNIPDGIETLMIELDADYLTFRIRVERGSTSTRLPRKGLTGDPVSVRIGKTDAAGAWRNDTNGRVEDPCDCAFRNFRAYGR